MGVKREYLYTLLILFVLGYLSA